VSNVDVTQPVTSYSNASATVGDDIAVEGVCDTAAQNATFHSVLNGGGAETSNHIVTTILTWLFQNINGDKVVVFVLDFVGRTPAARERHAVRLIMIGTIAETLGTIRGVVAVGGAFLCGPATG
jgi:hypothetical protein